MSISKINAIKKLLGIAFDEEVKAEEVNEGGAETKADIGYENTAKLSDGLEIRWNGELVNGTDVVVVNPEGIEPLKDGNHELEDGTILTIADGKIQAVTQATIVPDMDTEFKTQIEGLTAEIEALKATLTSVQASAETQATESTQAVAELKEAFSKALELIEAINVTPVVATPAPVNNQFSKKESKEAYLNQIHEAFKSLK